MKDFDGWNKEKQLIDKKVWSDFYFPREIWWCSMGINIGFEQNGTGEQFQRPVLIIKALGNNMCLVVPLTTSPKQHKYKIRIGTITGKESMIILSQIRVIDTRRLTNWIATMSKREFELIKKSIRDFI